MSNDMAQAGREALIHVILTGSVQEVRNFAADCTVINSLDHLRIYCQMIADAVGEYEGSHRLKLSEHQRNNLRVFTTAIFAGETLAKLDQEVHCRRRFRHRRNRRRHMSTQS